MIIQTIMLEGIFKGYWNFHRFKKFTDDNGNVIEYIYGDREVTKEEADEIYKTLLKNGKNMKRKIISENITVNDYITKLENSIDRYVEYIDDYTQYKQACEHNSDIRKRIEKYRKLM